VGPGLCGSDSAFSVPAFGAHLAFEQLGQRLPSERMPRLKKTSISAAVLCRDFSWRSRDRDDRLDAAQRAKLPSCAAIVALDPIIAQHRHVAWTRLGGVRAIEALHRIFLVDVKATLGSLRSPTSRQRRECAQSCCRSAGWALDQKPRIPPRS